MRVSPANQEWTPPNEFEEYKLVRWIGAGAMGEVYLAHDTLLDRPVAVKFIAAVVPDAETRRRFLVEARAAARLQHPNVLTIYRVGEIEGRPYIVSEFIRGAGLDEVVKPLAWERVLELAIGLAKGLAAAHRRGVLHRDIKPANAIIAEDGEAKLLDFGLAKVIGMPVPGRVTRETSDRVSGPAGPPGSPPPLGSPPAPGTPKAGAHGAEAFAATMELSASGAPAAGSGGVPAASGVPHHVDHEGSTARDLSAVETIPPELGSRPMGAGSPKTRVVGTPYYMAPETWRGEAPQRASDLYALGALLYELCSGTPPHSDVPFEALPLVLQQREARPLAEVAPAVDEELAAIIDRCLLRDATKRLGSADELRDELERVRRRDLAQADEIPEGNPYRGLEAFEAQHRALFFGRDPEIRTLIDRLRTEAFVLVAGDSGVGKSSLCRAGVLPLVAQGGLGGERTWRVVTLVPGRRPLDALVAALAPCMDADEEKLAERVSDEYTAVGYELRRKQGDSSGVLIFVDQMEELLTLAEPEQVMGFAELLGRFMTPSASVRVLGTVRGDFLTRLAGMPYIGEEITRALYLLRPLSPEETREAIVGPARAKGVTFESESLIETLIESTTKAEGALPLLQFALAEIWEARDPGNKAIPASALDAVGGVAGALARHGDGVLAHMLPTQRAAARRILTQLVTVDNTRARRTAEELTLGDHESATALEALVQGRLLVARESVDATSGKTVAVYEVAHEALLQGWSTLRDWLDETKSARVHYERLSRAATEWERLGRAPEALWSGPQLEEIDGVELGEVAPRDVEFLKASDKAVARRRLKRQAVLIGIPLLVGIVLTGIRLQVRADAKRSQREKDTEVATQLTFARSALESAKGKNAQVEQLRREAFKHFDSFRKESGEEVWARALALSSDVEKLYGQAGRLLETAHLLQPERQDVKDLLGDALLERALVAERDFRSQQLDELLQRLELYDANGERKRRFHSPGKISIDTQPSGCKAILERYEGNARGQRAAIRESTLATPINERALRQGSYRFIFECPGRSTVRYPFIIGRDDKGRGEDLKVELVPLPPEKGIPEGFVYIPAGRFLFGKAGDEEARRHWFYTSPVHQVRTDSYLIAENEATYAEWIAFLESLNASERQRRAPRTGAGGFSWYLELSKSTASSWTLAFQPKSVRYVGRKGSKIHYSSRETRQFQDWYRFPVTGISTQDAEQFATWLDRSGRVPGARLCTENEWERAARGADDREFPHGDKVHPDDANFDETYGKQPLGFGPDEVGAHPASVSPYGLYDSVGNVWEWTKSSLEPGQGIARGGSYYHDSRTIRVINREAPEASYRDPTIGVRLCASVPRF